MNKHLSLMGIFLAFFWSMAGCSDDTTSNSDNDTGSATDSMPEEDTNVISQDTAALQDSSSLVSESTDKTVDSSGDTEGGDSHSADTSAPGSTDVPVDSSSINDVSGTDPSSTDSPIDVADTDDGENGGELSTDTPAVDTPTDAADTAGGGQTDSDTQYILDVDSDAVVDPACPSIVNDTLSDLAGCDGVFNPGQVLDYHITIGEGDWNAILSDTGPEFTYHEAQFGCGNETPITVGIRKKRSGGTQKVGLKIDINELVDGQRYKGLRKLSFENGVSEGETSDDAEIKTYITEYLAWRLMNRACVMSSRTSFANVYLNGERLGVYINVEQVDKRFLKTRVGDNDGWLYKKSGSIGDGLKTHETDGLADPYADYFCFFENKGCDLQGAETLLAELPNRLLIEQFLRMGAVNALMGNADSPLLKDNNYYYYDWGTGLAPHQRVYFPWDLDTVMNRDFDVFSGKVPGGTTMYTDVLFFNWEGDYRAMMQELATNTNSLDVIQAELENAVTVAAEVLEADPRLGGTAQEAADSLYSWWDARLTQVLSQLGE